MKKVIRCLLLALFLAASGNAQDTSKKTTEPQAFKAGGTPIVIPAPTGDMVEVGYDNREFMEIFVPTSNRLLAAFVLTNELPRLFSAGDDLVMSKYATVQVPRRFEYMDCEESDFKEVTDGAKAELGDIINSSTKEAEEEFNRRMESLDLEEATVSLGQPIQLGCIFAKPDAYGFGMILPVSMGGKTTNIGAGVALVRAKKRLLFAYLYAEYKNEETVKWLRKTTEEWADAILEANK